MTARVKSICFPLSSLHHPDCESIADTESCTGSKRNVWNKGKEIKNNIFDDFHRLWAITGDIRHYLPNFRGRIQFSNSMYMTYDIMYLLPKLKYASQTWSTRFQYQEAQCIAIHYTMHFILITLRHENSMYIDLMEHHLLHTCAHM